MGAAITWYPIGETVAQSLDLSDFGLQRFAGGPASDAAQTITPAGYGVVLVHDLWQSFELHVDGISRTANAATWHQLQSFVAHAALGAEFAFAGESTDVYSALTTANAARGTNVITVGSTTGLSSSDSVVLEHALDPRRVTVSITGPPTGTTFQISPSLHHSMPAGSKVTHWEYFAKCRAKPGDVKFTERDAGLGANLWDFRMRFRTMRG